MIHLSNIKKRLFTGKTWLKIALCASIIFVLGIPSSAHAESFEQLDNSASYGPSYGYWYQNWNSPKHGASTSGDWWFYMSSEEPNFYELRRGGSFGCNEYSTSTEVSSPAWYKFTFTGNCNDSGYVLIKPYGVEQSVSTVYGSVDPDSFLDGYASSVPGLADLAFAFNSEGMPDPPGPSSSATITAPTNEEELTDFGLKLSGSGTDLGWNVEVLGPEERFYKVQVFYSQTTGVTNEEYTFFDSNSSSYQGSAAAETVVVAKQNLLDLGTWYARAYLVDFTDLENEEVIATSSEISIIIIGSTGSSGASEYDPPPDVECGETDFVCQLQNWFVTTMGNVARWLFIPTAASLQQFPDLWTAVKDKVPIGYLTAIMTSIGDISSAGSPIFEIDTLTSMASLVDGLDIIVGSILWFFVAFWLLRRISKLEL